MSDGAGSQGRPGKSPSLPAKGNGAAVPIYAIQAGSGAVVPKRTESMAVGESASSEPFRSVETGTGPIDTGLFTELAGFLAGEAKAIKEEARKSDLLVRLAHLQWDVLDDLAEGNRCAT